MDSTDSLVFKSILGQLQTIVLGYVYDLTYKHLYNMSIYEIIWPI